MNMVYGRSPEQIRFDNTQTALAWVSRWTEMCVFKAVEDELIDFILKNEDQNNLLYNLRYKCDPIFRKYYYALPEGNRVMHTWALHKYYG
jgi:hypothetical protein